MVKNKKGSRRERELIRLFAGEHDKSPFGHGDWAPMRAPSSGAATQRELPDVLVGNGEWAYAIEAKASGGDPIYIDKEEVDSLQFFADHFPKMFARIGVRFDREEWRFFNPRALHETDKSVRVKASDLDDGKTLEDLDNGPL